MMKPTEHDEQAALVEACLLLEGHHPELALLFAIPNGGERHIAVAARLKAEGVKAGVPDLFLPVARGGCHGLWIEMKVGRNRLTANQLAWVERLRGQGYRVEVCYGYEAALAVLLEYLQCT
jgi:hypothetical protein